MTAMIGVLGTTFGLIFTNPNIKSLFDTFVMIIGLFMGVLGGLFLLGMLSRRANAVGAIAEAGIMYSLWQWSEISGYLYTACGIISCMVVGYLVSLIAGTPAASLEGLTIYSVGRPASSDAAKEALLAN